MKTKGLIIIVLVAIGVIGFASAYTVDETEQVVVTQFGKVVGEPKIEPGLYFRIPFIQHANYFPKNLLQWDGDPGQIPTLDKKFIWVDSFARWKITDPIKFFQTVGNTLSAQGRLDDIIDPAVRNAVTSYPLNETVRRTDRVLDTFEVGLTDQIFTQDVEPDEEEEVRQGRFNIRIGREKITEGIQRQAQPKLEPFGIEVVDVKIKRVNYTEQVRESVYGRMIAERKQIAEKFRSEGKGEAQKILGDKERDLKLITSEAYRTAQEIKGRAEAEATRLYADAFNIDPEFYSFQKTLEVYNEALDDRSTMILSTDSEIFRFLKGSETLP
ncbi:MAG: protease modulator HflC [Desulfosarcinaceae bacterium]|nr:protease modulator HflC [Desulfosarcinaceae bacterium]